MSSISVILRDIVEVIDEIIGGPTRVFRRREVMKSVFTPSQLDVWKQAETMEEKALAEERKETDKSEKKFFDILSKQFGEQSKKFFDDPATQKAIGALADPENWYFKEGKPHRPKPAVWNKYKAGAEKFFGQNLAKKVKTRLTITVKDIYEVVKKITADGVLQTPFKWTATDKSSTDKLAKDVMYWVSDANGRHFEPAVADTTRKVMSQGLGFRETEDEMKKALGQTYKDKSDSYWFLMGSVGVQRARSFSKLSAFEDAGVTEYEIFAVLDNRTTPQCRYMNGRIFKVSNGQSIRNQTEAAKNPEGVREVYPWIRYSTSRAAKGLDALYVNQPGGRVYLPSSHMKSNAPTQPVKPQITAGQKSTLDKLVPLPPYHGHCRTSYVITEKAIQQLTQERVEEEKPVGVPPFDVNKAQKVPAGTTGSHGAYWATDPETGRKYLFKPPTFGTGDADAHMNYAIHRLMKEVGVGTPNFFIAQHEGKPVSIQSEIKSLVGDLNGMDVKALDQSQILEIQKNFVVDWLTGNFDCNKDNHVVRANGGIVGVDKGQAFKFYGQEKLDGKWKPTNNFGRPVIYDILDEYAKGTDLPIANPNTDKDFSNFIKSVEKIPKETIREMFMPYAVRAEAQGVKVFNKDNKVVEDFTVERFFKKLEKRQANLSKDFGKLYKLNQLKHARVKFQEEQRKRKEEEEARRKREEEERKRREAEAAKVKRKPKRKPEIGLPIGDRVEDDIPFLDSQLLKEAVKAGADGKAFLIGGGGFHNAQAVVYKVGGKGEGRGVHVEGRLSRSNAEKLHVFLRRFGQQAPEQTQEVDPTWGKVKKIFTNIIGHNNPDHPAYDGKVPEETKKAWQHQVLLFGSIIDKAKNEGDETTAAKYQHYKDILHQTAQLDEYDDLVMKPEALKKKFEPYKAPVEKMPKGETPEGVDDVRKVQRFDWNRNRTKGNKVNTTTKDGEEKYTWNRGEMFTFKMGDVEFEFTPHSESNPIVAQRKLVMRVKDAKKQNAKDLQQALKDFSELTGVPIRPATSDDMELAYLRKYAVQAGIEEHWKRAAPKNLPVQEQVEALREEAAKFVNTSVNELRKRDTYDFRPFYNSTNGWAKFGLRFDTTKEDFNKEFRRVTLQHRLYSRTEGLLKTLGKNSVSMESTEEKLRKGIKTPVQIAKNTTGMSPEEDRKVGGADYHFARLARDTHLGDLVYNRRIMLELDTNSYVSDRYGAQRGQYRWEDTERNRTVSDMKRGIDKDSNETNPFKTLPFADYVEVIRARNDSTRNGIIEELKRLGIEELGGRPVEERVVVIMRRDTGQVMQENPDNDFKA